MIKADRYYREVIDRLETEGVWDEDPRPKWEDGEKAHSKFIIGVFETYDLFKGEYPITTLRNTAIKTGIKEIFWIYQKQSNKLSDAHDLGIKWWDNWDIGDGTIGQRYGATVRRYDLINNLLKNLKEDPFSRRHIMDLYQYSDLNETKGLFPCAYKTTWSVRKIDNDYYLDMALEQRSSDYIVANFINKIQYVALQMMVATHLGYKLGKFMHYVQNLHVYDRHMEALEEIKNRKSIDFQPKIILQDKKDFYDYTIDDFKVISTNEIKKLEAELPLAI